MKRIILLFVLGVLFVACAPETTSETAVSVPEEPERPETAVSDEEVAPETESEEAPVVVADMSGFPATTVAEASIVRDQDWTKGTDDPLVSIIEYGDFQ